MKLKTITIVTAACLSLFLIPSCNSEDPSALSESKKSFAEVVAKNNRLEGEIEGLKTELQEAQAKEHNADAVKMPTAAEIESNLDLEATKLKETARRQFPNSKVESFGTWDLDIPSFDRPFSCKAKVVIKAPNGYCQTLYWIGSANMKGEWTFSEAKDLEPQKSGKHDVGIDNSSLMVPAEETPPEKPLPTPVEDKPKPKYDIPLDNPVMGPGAR